MENLQDMKLDELMELAKSKGITKFENAKNPYKPNKTEAIEAITNGDSIAVVDDIDNIMAEEEQALIEAKKLEAQAAEEEVAKKAEKEAKSAGELMKKLGKNNLKKKQYKDLMKYNRVLITSNDDKQDKAELIFVTWGNRLLGHHTDRVYLGKPWHVREGALQNMKRARVVVQQPKYDKQGNENGVAYTEIPGYNIVELGLLKPEEYAEMGKKQAMRNAAAESLAI